MGIILRVEWTAYLRNTGSKATPLIENVLGLDSKFQSSLDSKDCIPENDAGGQLSAGSFEPLSYYKPRTGWRGASSRSGAGRRTAPGPISTSMAGRSAILALGWPGQWQARFSQEGAVISACGGQETTHLVLQPGEAIRTPLVAVLFWKGEDWIAGAESLAPLVSAARHSAA